MPTILVGMAWRFWGGGWLFDMGVRDLAGGIVVHATAGVSALVLAILLGKRKGFPQHPHPPHNPAMVFIGVRIARAVIKGDRAKDKAAGIND